QVMTEAARKAAEYSAEKIVNALGGYGIFGVELFIKGDKVIFNEVSPRPHDTGLVTLISQELSEFALHVRAFTGMPINSITQYGTSASAVILGQGTSTNIRYDGLCDALTMPQTQVRLFGKPDIDGRRRLGVALTRRNSVDKAIEDAINSAQKIKITY
ncbi:ATP-grasp domain-containing protein, partial [Vibrio genomosp. F10]